MVAGSLGWVLAHTYLFGGVVDLFLHILALCHGVMLVLYIQECKKPVQVPSVWIRKGTGLAGSEDLVITNYKGQYWEEWEPRD